MHNIRGIIFIMYIVGIRNSNGAMQSHWFIWFSICMETLIFFTNGCFTFTLTNQVQYVKCTRGMQRGIKSLSVGIILVVRSEIKRNQLPPTSIGTIIYYMSKTRWQRFEWIGQMTKSNTMHPIKLNYQSPPPPTT